MKTEALFLFLIMLLGLALCSFLGGDCGKEGMTGNPVSHSAMTSSAGTSTAHNSQYDNYNHYTGNSTQQTHGTTYYGPNGETATVSTNSSGTQTLQIVLPNTSTPVTFSPQQSASSVESYVNFYGENGTATKYYGPNGATATFASSNNGQNAVVVSTQNGTYYYNASGTASNANPPPPPPTNPPPLTNSYADSLPNGIPYSQIPPGQEDLYILKSEVVPPVCPACPVAASIPRQEACPACPACARCPEPSFECKKVPNYNAINQDYLPTPVLTDFSQFGM